MTAYKSIKIQLYRNSKQPTTWLNILVSISKVFGNFCFRNYSKIIKIFNQNAIDKKQLSNCLCVYKKNLFNADFLQKSRLIIFKKITSYILYIYIAKRQIKNKVSLLFIFVYFFRKNIVEKQTIYTIKLVLSKSLVSLSKRFI